MPIIKIKDTLFRRFQIIITPRFMRMFTIEYKTNMTKSFNSAPIIEIIKLW